MTYIPHALTVLTIVYSPTLHNDNIHSNLSILPVYQTERNGLYYT